MFIDDIAEVDETMSTFVDATRKFVNVEKLRAYASIFGALLEMQRRPSFGVSSSTFRFSLDANIIASIADMNDTRVHKLSLDIEPPGSHRDNIK